MSRETVSLNDKFDLSRKRIFLSGSQAIVRLLSMQKARDRSVGLNTAGYVTGYRGSPLGGLDQQFWRAGDVLAAHDIVFQPAINEDLAATALSGTQQAELRGDGRYDGVFGIWYGKGPGVDRSGDAFRHANLAGNSPHGGVVALMGDDHTCESSTTAHQSEFALIDAMMPIFNPAGVQEILDYGLFGWALSRFAGTWVGLKCVKDTIESTATVDGTLDRIAILTPDDFAAPADGLHVRQFDHPVHQEHRLHQDKMAAVGAFLRANRLDKVIHSGGRAPRVGVVSTGKSWLDVAQAIDDLGIDEVGCADLGLRLFKVAVPWPLEPEGIRQFAHGLELLIVVEEKRSVLETQIKEILYGSANAPAVIGKRDENRDWLFPSSGSLDTNHIAIAIGERLLARTDNQTLARRVAQLRQAQARLETMETVSDRRPYFCAGCPHNSSTTVPEGSRAYAGIGCHYMVQWMDRSTEGYTQMGGEGANWVGEAPFSVRGHVFQNMGDGTYNHSGLLAIRAARAAGVNVTFKILFNDAVAMTGGQPNDGGLSPLGIARQVAAEGVAWVVVVSDEPEKYPRGMNWPDGTTIHHRSKLNGVQRELAAVRGVTVLIYDQTCAAEKRRRRKRGSYPDPDRRVVINELVCEGCGDCGLQSNCLAIQPTETVFGRKRRIDQASCNKDFSCIEGFCPSFVTVHGAKIRKARSTAAAVSVEDLPEPDQPALERPFGMLITGVGGTGVVTVGAVVGMAAHLNGHGCGIIDMAGLAQKGGAVVSHLRLAAAPEDINAIRIPAGGADLVLACDMVVAGSARILSAIDKGRTALVINSHEIYPGDFIHQADFTLPTRNILKSVGAQAGDDQCRVIDAHKLAAALVGDPIAANMLLLGHAWQLGKLPVSADALEQAITLNGVAVDQNITAFRWGRRSAHDPGEIARLLDERMGPQETEMSEKDGLDALMGRHEAFLTAYQNGDYATIYRARVDAVRRAEVAANRESTLLAHTVAANLFKLMGYKDEYEVARLFTDGTFERQLARQFESWDRLEFHLAPPLLARRDPATGHLMKRQFGSWVTGLFAVLAKLKWLRGTRFDIFGATQERRQERRLIAEYNLVIDEIVARLNASNLGAAVALAAYPGQIRGFGHVKEASIAPALAARDDLIEAFRSEQPISRAAE